LLLTKHRLELAVLNQSWVVSIDFFDQLLYVNGHLEVLDDLNQTVGHDLSWFVDVSSYCDEGIQGVFFVELRASSLHVVLVNVEENIEGYLVGLVYVELWQQLVENVNMLKFYLDCLEAILEFKYVDFNLLQSD
jgi:hypothetical protein